MAQVDKVYAELVSEIITEGYEYTDESRDVTCRQISTKEITLSLKNEFPILTTKEVPFHSIITELLWFLRGEDNIKYLLDYNVNIWNKDAYNLYLKKYRETYEEFTPLSLKEFINDIKEGITDENIEGYKFGDVGRGYGVQWRDFNGTDQIFRLINDIKNKGITRRHITMAWNPAELDKTALPPCHYGFEVILEKLTDRERLDLLGFHISSYYNTAGILSSYNVPKYSFTLKWLQRSVDTFLGLPFNISSYATLAEIIGVMTNIIPNKLVGSLSNVHIYEPHNEQIVKQLGRDYTKYNGAKLVISDEAKQILVSDTTIEEIFNSLKPEDFWLEGYESYGKLPAAMIAPKN